MFTPLLASTSVGTLEFRTALEPIRSKRSKVSFFQGWADGVDFKNNKITVEEAVDDVSHGETPAPSRSPDQQLLSKKVEKGGMFDLTYDKLIIAVGCYSQTFRTPGVKEHALFLKDVGDARKIRNRVLACFEAAALPTTPDEMKRQLLNFAVVGGGPTGIEFSAELHDIIHEDLAKMYPDLMKHYAISVYDVAPKVLPSFDEKLGKYAIETFKREGISVKTSHHVEELRRGVRNGNGQSRSPYLEELCFTLKVKEEGELGVGMVVWSTGLMTNPLVQKLLKQILHLRSENIHLGLGNSAKTSGGEWFIRKHPKTEAILVDDRLRASIQLADGTEESSLKAHISNVFAMGDCASIEGTSYPATAQVANQQALWLSRRLNKGDLDQRTFTWRNMGIMAYIGNWNAIFQSGGADISGRFAWFIWRGAYLTKSVSWRNKVLIPVYW